VDSRALLGVSHLILYDQSLRELSRSQLLALDLWIISGGRMIILGSINHALYQEPNLSRFLPVHVTGLTRIASLPHLTSPAFDLATVNGQPANLNSSEEIDLIDSNSNVIGTPSAPDPDADSFNACTWATSCSAPSSS
jgi:hypothetical protein